MKRSELNKNIREAIEFVENRGLCFPEFAKWGPEDWKILSEDQRERRLEALETAMRLGGGVAHVIPRVDGVWFSAETGIR